MEWVFDGIGTAIVSTFLGIIIGGIGGYSIGVRKTNKMKQMARDNTNQTQIGEINTYGNDHTKSRK